MLGDFLFAQSSWFLANLNNLEVRRGYSIRLEGLSGRCGQSCVPQLGFACGRRVLHDRVHTKHALCD